MVNKPLTKQNKTCVLDDVETLTSQHRNEKVEDSDTTGVSQDFMTYNTCFACFTLYYQTWHLIGFVQDHTNFLFCSLDRENSDEGSADLPPTKLIKNV